MKVSTFLVSVFVLSFHLITATAQDIVFTLDNDSIEYGAPGELLSVHGTISNTSAGPIEVYIERVEENLPVGWQTFFCTDVCLTPIDSVYHLNTYAVSDQAFYLDFVTSAIEDSGNALMRFTNQSNANNTMEQRLYGITDSSYVGISTPIPGQQLTTLYPNPVINNNWLTVRLGSEILESEKRCELQFYDIEGRLVGSTPNIGAAVSVIDISAFSPGIYVYKLLSEEIGEMLSQGKLVIQR